VRSWLSDFRPPLWSYQLCGGITRIGDPQSFAFSPLFLFNIVFGTFWGLKLLVFFSSLVGYVYARKIFYLVARLWLGSGPLPANFKGWVEVLVLGLIFNNFFLWHIHHGHITFAIMYLLLPFIHLVLEDLLGIPKIKEIFIGGTSLITVLTAGYYPALLYMLLPLFLATAITIVWALFSMPHYRRQLLMSSNRLMLISFICLAISAYRLIPTYVYQSEFPRTLVNNKEEIIHIKDFFVYNFLPTINYLFANKIFHDGVWEKSFFSINTWIFLIIAWVLLFQKKSFKLPLSNHSQKVCIGWIVSLAIVYFFFCLGSIGPVSFFWWINKFIFHDSLREASRFLIGFSLIIFLLLAVLAIRYRTWPKVLNKKLQLFLLAILNLQIFFIFYGPFTSQHLYRFQKMWNRDHPVNQRLQYLTITSAVMLGENAILSPSMYPAVANNLGVLNCYIFLKNRFAITQGRIDFSQTDLTNKKFYFLDGANLNEQCLKDSYFTQNDLFISPVCPENLCLNLNNVNIYKKTSFNYDPIKQKFCRSKH
jgi:hypothetical protein